MKKLLKKCFVPVMVLAMVTSFVFIACQELVTDNTSGIEEYLFARAAVGSSWNFQGQDSGKKLVDGATASADITYLDSMTLLGSQRNFIWKPTQAAVGSSTKGCIQSGGATASGKYFLKIDSVQGPFRITLNYTDTGSNGSRYVEVFVNGSSKKKGGNTTDEKTLVSSTYDYTGTDKVTIQLGCNGGIRLFDVKLSAVSSSSTTTTATVAVTGVSVSGGNFSLAVGSTKTLSATLTPSNATNKTVTWSSSATGTATVDSAGKVTAVKAGTATITAKTADGGKTATVTVTVTAASSGSGTSTTTTTGSSSNSTQATTIFNNLKGKTPTTNGWADKGSVKYASPSSVTLIDSSTYPDAVKRRTAFTDLVKSDSAKFIVIAGDIDLSDGKISDSNKSYFDKFNSDGKRTNGDIVYQIGSNTTIIGINSARLKFGGFQIKGKSNVIIRNVTFYDAHGSTEINTSKDSSSKASADNLEISGSSNGIWVDHCKFTDGTCNDMTRNLNHDGSFDIKQGKNITVSWCEFTNHDKVMLVGSNDKDYLTASDRQITMHHCYFHKTTQRTPRTRGTQMHIYNCYYNDIGVSGNTGYCLGPGVNAEFVVENNYFGSLYSSSTKVVDYYDTSANPAKVYSDGNNKTIARSSNDKTTNKPWTPSYSYTKEANSGLSSSVPKGAGPVLTSF